MTSHGRNSIDAGKNFKRQKTRKGTRSCWACKRRKVKCTYASRADDMCIGCTRRCLDCVGQEFPEQDPRPSSKSRLVGDRIGRLEAMMQQLAEQVGGASSSSSAIPANIFIPVPPSMSRPKHRTLSQTLLAAYPSPSDFRIIGDTGGSLVLYLSLAFVTPSHLLERRVALESERLWGPRQQQYTAETHPVLIARQMLLLAGVLQYLHAAEAAKSSGSGSSSSSIYQQLGELSLPPRVLARQLAEAAMTFVTAHDRFTTSTLEGLECLWLEAAYHEHNGHPRQSWLACRRAISAWQLMGFHRRRSIPMTPPRSILRQPDGEAVDLQHIWLHLVHSELVLCLALEMPPSAACSDDTSPSVADSVTAEDDSTATAILEKRHAAIASHLLKWSERDLDFENLDAAHQIRTELDEAASAIPSGWWRTPSLHEGDDDKRLFGNILQLKEQIFHSHLLLLVELPFMLQAACGESTITTTTANEHRHHGHDHNRNHNHLLGTSHYTCLKTSRNLLHHFIHLRSSERTAGYFRLLDYYAWQAAAALLLGRLLDGRRTTTTNIFLAGPGHQQSIEDRALASEAMERMRLAGEDDEDDGDEDIHYFSGSAARYGSEDVLSSLLAMETAGIMVVVTYRTPGGVVLGSGSAVLGEEGQDTIVLRIPFVGIVSITPRVRDCSLSSGTVSGFQMGLDGEAVLQGLDGDSVEEEEEQDDETAMTRAMKLRRSAKWSIAPYMLRGI
ncbi:hypothetical protein CONLIGDRAFT_636921 [Coniochaeta ligniaria NRRL 30616]|uniref:Zn(2)-C6 fungal-type domain-containing protein n=1 Tax=Coniochaeta ligniaria NRRL 30616 TaxID=1408157 RepID=A0A1J7J2S5_9PEZI|nr:hypothetical protein CONLIGDRAFT_636921 [Coniochaeta ligniaria NRRL 30616]